jgi:aryl-alcohol dehydrogenase-like predicted oxidoreductase
MGALEQLRREGKIAAIGLSNVTIARATRGVRAPRLAGLAPGSVTEYRAARRR